MKKFDIAVYFLILVLGMISLLIILFILVFTNVASKPTKADFADPIVGSMIYFAHSNPYATFFLVALLLAIAASCAVGGDAIGEWWLEKQEISNEEKEVENM